MSPPTPAAPAGGSAEARPLAVFDVDGVLADVGHRVHHLEGPRKNWRAFFAGAASDPPLSLGIELASELSADHDLGYLTGRPESLRQVTQRWLSRHGLPAGPLWMRAPGDFRAARVMKLEAVRQLATSVPSRSSSTTTNRSWTPCGRPALPCCRPPGQSTAAPCSGPRRSRAAPDVPTAELAKPV